MSGIATAVVAGAVISGVVANNAAKKQQRSADRANATIEDQYWQTREDQQPWRQAGEQALSQLVSGIGGTYQAPKTAENFDSAAYLAAHPDVAADPVWGGSPFDHWQQFGKDDAFTYTPQAQALMEPGAGGVGRGDFNKKFSLADFEKDPGYAFRLNQGLDAVQGSRAARGSMMSGSTLKALSNYGSDYASSEYGKAYDRFNNDQTTRFNRLSSIAGIGQTATNNVGTAGAAAANGVAGNIIGAGNAAAAGQVGMANAVSGGVSNLQSLYQLNRLTQRPGTSGYYGSGAGSAFGGSQNYTGAGSTGSSAVGNAGAGDYAAYYGG